MSSLSRGGRRLLLLYAVLIVVVLIAAAGARRAEALAPCKPGNGTVHCYAVASLYGEHLSAITAEQLQANMPGGGGFATAEGWASFDCGGCQFGDWIEAGIMISPFYLKDSKPHTFFASEHEGQFHVHLETTPEWPSVTKPTYYTIIDDRYRNGCYYVGVLLSYESQPAAYAWKMPNHAVFCGRPYAIKYQQAGGEIEAEPLTRVLGSSGTAWSEEEGNNQNIAGWTNWYDGFTSYTVEPGLSAAITSAPGNIEWHTAEYPTATATAASQLRAHAASAGMVVTTGKALSVRMKLTPRGAIKPRGTYRAVLRNAAGQTEGEYVGTHYPTEAEVRSGGQG